MLYNEKLLGTEYNEMVKGDKSINIWWYNDALLWHNETNLR